MEKTREVGLLDGEKIKRLPIVATEYTNVTNRQTDRHRTTALCHAYA